MAGWVVLSLWAAPRKLPSVTTHWNVSIALKSTMDGCSVIKIIY
jgi:hypothetical protein